MSQCRFVEGQGHRDANTALPSLAALQVLPTIMALCNNISVVPDAIALSHEDVEGLRGCMPTPDEQKILKVPPVAFLGG